MQLLLKEAGTSSDDGLQWTMVKERQIQAGTLERIVECLTSATGELNSKHFNELFATYRAIATAKDVLNLILQR